MREDKDINIIKNLKTIEWLKAEQLSSVAELFQVLNYGDEDSKEEIINIISNTILISYLLGKKLGISYEKMDANIQNKLRLSLAEENNRREWVEDLSGLLAYFMEKG
ncbi:MAG TPA: MazG-like family protein [Tissierellales bacterium]|nr:MazG-like family protein [Tissierellales bacterium]